MRGWPILCLAPIYDACSSISAKRDWHVRFSAPSWTAPRLYLRRVVTGVGRHRAAFVPRSAMLVITALACGFAEGANHARACPLALLLTFPTQGGLLRARSSWTLARCAFVCPLLFNYIASGKTRGSPYSSDNDAGGAAPLSARKLPASKASRICAVPADCRDYPPRYQ